IVMKKGRPGVLLAALVEPAARRRVEVALFQETTTFGIRRRACARTVLAREATAVATPLGPVAVKLGRLEGRVISATPEYEACRALAREQGVPLRRVYALAQAAAAALLD